MHPDLRVLTAADLPAAWACIEGAFGQAPHPADKAVELAVVDPSRFYAGFGAGRVVATAGSFAFTMAVPGAALPVAGVTWVGVDPVARRQGLMTALMTRQLTDLHATGEAVAALFASQGSLYGRYGYGLASWAHKITVPAGAAFARSVAPGGLRSVDPADVPRALYDAVAARAPGCPARDDAWWAQRLHHPEHARAGASPLRCVVAEGPDGPQGYALYATAVPWSDGLPDGTVTVREVVATTREAHARLWRFLLDHDLMATVAYPRLAVDDPLLHGLLADPRAARPRLVDGLWVRLVDVGAALGARRYAAPVDVVLDVVDAVCPWNTGRWRLSGDRSGATCSPTADAADVTLTAADLGAAYLGGSPLRARADVPAEVDAAFGAVGPSPWCPLTF